MNDRVRVGMVLLVAAALLQPVSSLAGADDDGRLDGRWQIVQMVRDGQAVPVPDGYKMAMQFRVSNHTWKLIVHTPKGGHTEQGTWELHGDMLVTRSEAGDKTERSKIRFIDAVTFVLNKGREQLILRKV